MTSTVIRLPTSLAAGSLLRLYDAAGNLTLTLPANGTRVLSGSGLRPGVYVLRAGNESTRLVKVDN